MRKSTEAKRRQYVELEAREKKLQKQLDEVHRKMDELFDPGLKRGKSRNGELKIGYYQEIMRIFKENPEAVFSARNVSEKLEEKFGKELVDLANVKASLFYASRRKSDLERVGRGQYKLFKKAEVTEHSEQEA
jgi:hypothetical protein